jgi:predicted kinase
MPTLILTVGLPGSGKTTWARAQQVGRTDIVRVNRDDIRDMLLQPWPYGGPAGELNRLERIVTGIQIGAVRNALRSGLDVIVDDTNLSHSVRRDFRALASDFGASVKIQNFQDVPLETCIERDALRERPVGASVIQGMFDRYLRAGKKNFSSEG